MSISSICHSILEPQQMISQKPTPFSETILTIVILCSLKEISQVSDARTKAECYINMLNYNCIGCLFLVLSICLNNN